MEIAETTPQLCAKIHLVIPRAEIRHVMGPARAELGEVVAAQGVAIAGPWFTHHLRLDDDEFDFELCVPVASPVLPAGRVQPGEWPAMRVARTVYHGGYEGLGEAWEEFDDSIATRGHHPHADLYEVYLTGMESGLEPSEFRTQLTRKLID